MAVCESGSFNSLGVRALRPGRGASGTELSLGDGWGWGPRGQLYLRSGFDMDQGHIRATSGPHQDHIRATSGPHQGQIRARSGPHQGHIMARSGQVSPAV